MPSSSDIRQQFIDFFVNQCGHTFVPSSPVVPLDDPTLLFTNAGMNQFKDVFLGIGSRPYKRAVDSQKVIRASGKHNDLEDVGRDTYHHTFFEMLGNWSFGDYYKAEAIRWAWELLTKVWGIDKSRLHATVFGGAPDEGLAPDDEAAELWTKVTDIDPSHVHRFGKKDNFWAMGETGPCGPCSEIHIDRTPDGSGGKLVNAGHEQVIEIWNLVFIQYNRPAPGAPLEQLPAKHVDTGMGFERICSVLQGKSSNYDTDIFMPIMEAISEFTNRQYVYDQGKDSQGNVTFRVIADHARALTFAITDGALPSNKGRGSVLRSIARRAATFSYKHFNQREPFVYKLVPVIVKTMGQAFPELRSNPNRVAEVIRNEEEDFLKTIERGLVLFNEAEKRAIEAGPMESISGKDVFDLYTTYGFPPDLTRMLARERSMTIDEFKFQKLMKEHGEKSKYVINAEGGILKLTGGQVALNVSAPLPTTDDRPKWSGNSGTATILGWIADNQFITSGQLLSEAALILDRTCFYAEAGGQVGDVGEISTETGKFAVTNTLKLGNAIAHIGQMTDGHFEPGQHARLQVSPEREFTRKNHTATHLVHWALQKVLGEHVEQRGSKVKPDEFTFDFSHNAVLSQGQRQEVERLVNEKVYFDLPVNWRIVPIAEAKKLPGVKAFFGDKYGDEVRVVEIGDGFSREFCGGTHLDRTGSIGLFKIISEEAVGKGIRRITAVTARQAIDAIQNEERVLAELTGQFKCQVTDLPKRVHGLQDEIKKLQQQLKKGTGHDLAMVADKLLAEAMDVHSVKVITGVLPEGVSDEAVRTQIDRMRQKAGSCVIIVGWPVAADKVTLIAAATEDVAAQGVHAGKLIGLAAKIVGGKGGGKPTLAQAGGKDPSKLEEALHEAKNEAAAALKASS